MPNRHTIRRRGRAVSDRLARVLRLPLAPSRHVAIVQGEAWGLIALTLLPQARDTKVAATLERMRARCSC